MANSIELITKYSTKAWDKVYKRESISSLLDAPGAQVQFTGAKTVKIAKFSAGGLGNYYRNNEGDDRVESGSHFGYAESNVGLVWEEFTLTQDRSAKYPVELFDNEETDGLVLGAATTEISRTIMIPEVDAYCFSKIADNCDAGFHKNLVDGSITAGKELSELNKALLYFEEHEVPAEKQIIFVSPKFMTALRNDNTELSRYLMQNDYKKDVSFTLTSYEGRQIAVVPPQRFKTKINTSGKGYTWDKGSKDIDFMVVAKDAVMHIVKYNKIKIISGDMNLAGQGFDGYSIFARIYHDVFVPDNKKYALYTHTGAYTADVKPILEITRAADTTVTGVRYFPQDRILTVATSGSVETVGNDVTGELTIVKPGVKVGNSTKVYLIEGTKVLAETTTGSAPDVALAKAAAEKKA